jgi:CDP-glucose 4,6-dehydratase
MNSFWQGRKVFIAGPASFLGSWLCLTLQELGAEISGFGEAPTKNPSLFELANIGARGAFTWGRLQDTASVKAALHFSEAEILIHCNELTEQEPLGLFSTAVDGTGALLEALRETATVRSALFLSSDKVYARALSATPITEENPIAPGGIPATAKLCSELMALSYKNSFFNPGKFNKHKVALATARLGSAIGGGDFSDESLLFEALSSFSRGSEFLVRKPHSVRTWIHVLDQVRGVLALAEGLYVKGPKLEDTYNIVSSETASVEDVVSKIASQWGSDVQWKKASSISSNPSYHPSLSHVRMTESFAWQPLWALDSSLSKVTSWYKDYYQGKVQALELCQRDIQSFLKTAL